MYIATVDLDDTIMYAGKDYIQAKEKFASFMSSEYNINKDIVLDTIEEVNKTKLQELGLSLERFPASFKITFRLLVDEPRSEKHIIIADRIAREAYLTREEYAERGFMPGAREMVALLRRKFDEIVLLTAGVKNLQMRKVKALRLNESFHDIHIVKMGCKGEKIEEIAERKNNISTSKVYHIGNSEKGDVKPVLETDAQIFHIPSHQWRGNRSIDYKKENKVKKFEDISDFNSYIRNGKIQLG